MNQKMLQTELNDINAIINDLETKRAELGDEKVDDKISELKEKIRQIEIKIN